MSLARRTFLKRSGLGVAALAAACGTGEPQAAITHAVVGTGGSNGDEWDGVRELFDIADEPIDFGALLISSHPRPVREKIEEYRAEIDRSPTVYLEQNNRRLQVQVTSAAAEYLGTRADDIALTESTTMGLGLLYNGLRLEPGQEILTTANDYYVTHEALRTATDRTGATERRVPLYEHGEAVSADELVERIVREIRPETRVLALTWVHSSTGLKLPVPALAAEVNRINGDRGDDDRVLFCLDGVHGFGVENVTVDDLGVDFMAAGCHKWLFGPRGTGLLWGRQHAWPLVRPTIPSFVDDGPWQAWLEEDDLDSPSTAARVTPGGFKAFEHVWAVNEAFAFHQRLGKARVEARTHALARHLKEGLAAMNHVRLITPMEDELSAGVVCFDVDGLSPRAAIRRLRERGIAGTVTPYAQMHARLTPSIRNTPGEVDRALDAIRGLA